MADTRNESPKDAEAKEEVRISEGQAIETIASSDGLPLWAEARFPSRWPWRYKHPQTTRCELACLLNWWRGRPKHKRPWLCDAWQDYYLPNPFVYRAGVNYLLSRPRLRKWFDEPYHAEARN